MGTRVLRAGNWYHPGWLGAGCDERVLGLHAAHVRGAGGLGCAAVRAKGGGEKGRAHLVVNARLESRMPRRRLANSRMVPLERSRRARTGRAKHRLVQRRESPARACNVCTSHVRSTGRLMGTRVLRAGNWYRPGWLGAGCDARVLGLHAAHVRGAGGLGCAAVRAKGGGEKGRAHLVLNARLESRKPRRRLANLRMVPLERSR